MTSTQGPSVGVGAVTSKHPELISYRYFGTYSETLGRHEAEGWVTIRRDMRGPVGLRTAPLGIALLDTAGINVDPIAVVSPTRIDLHLFEPALDVSRVHIAGKVLREGRSQFFTEGRLTDAGNPDRVIGLGSTHWAVSGPNPDYHYPDSRPGLPDGPDLPPLYEPFGARRLADGNLEISELGPELSSGSLHQGPFQVIPEEAAYLAAEAAVGTDQFWIEHQGTSIVAKGLGAPFVTRAEVLRVAAGCINVRVELRAAGAGDALCSVTMCRFRLT